jgi:Domain of unknown function (DUF4269)
MSKDFFNIEYLNHGSEVQREGFAVLKNTGILDILQEFDPVLAGTLPLDIFIQGSDLDILCHAVDLSAFEYLLDSHFSKYLNFTTHKTSVKGTKSVIARFHAEDFDFEIFGQPIATRNQLAFRHLLIEDKILQMKGEEFKRKIIALKLSGIKTEPAFAYLLNMSGDPYESLLSLAV